MALTTALTACAAAPAPSWIGSVADAPPGGSIANHWGQDLQFGATDVAYGPDEHHRLDVLPADDQAPARRGTIVFVHGGGFTVGDRSQLLGGDHGAIVYQRTRGWDIVTVGYRVGADTYPDGYHDVALAVSWVAEHGGSIGLDTSKVFLAGHSAGGSLAAMVATTAGQPTPYGVVPPVDGWLAVSSLHEWVSGRYISDTWGMPASDRGKRSTTTTLDRSDPPGYLVHADLDPIVRPLQSELLYERALAVGANVQFDRVDSGDQSCRLHVPLCGANIASLNAFLD